MAKTITIDGIDFLDNTGGDCGQLIYELCDEITASTVGVYTDLESLCDGISAMRTVGREDADIWGSVYCANRTAITMFASLDV